MSLPNDDVLDLLKSKFVLGARNIEKDEHVGMSHGYKKTHTAVGTTNGAGGRNVQLFIIAPDSTVLHAMPGFWHPEDLAHELRFGLQAWRLWNDEARSLEQKRDMYRRMVLTDLRNERTLGRRTDGDS